MRNQCMSVSSFAVDELHQAVLLRLEQASSFCFQVTDPFCGNGHGIGGDIVAVHHVLKREYEFSVHDLVGAELPDQNRDNFRRRDNNRRAPAITWKSRP
jgi:hypothetical protein